MRVAKYISSELNQSQGTQDTQHQYTIYKEGGPGFTRYIVYMDNKANIENNVINKVTNNEDNDNMSRRPAMQRHKSLPPRERRKTGVAFVEGK